MPWAAGLLVGTALATAVPGVRPLAVSGFVLVMLWARLGRSSGRWPARRSVAGLVAAAFLGLFLGHGGETADDLGGLDVDRPVELTGIVRGHVESRPDPYADAPREHVELRATAIRQGERVVDSRVRVLVSVPRADTGRADPRIGWGSRLRLRGYLRRAPAWRNVDVPHRDGPWRMRVESRRFLTVEAEPSWQSSANAWRRGLNRRVEAIPGDAGALTASLLLGDRSRLPERWSRALRASGLAHVLAVSGLHIGLVGGLVWLAAAPWPRGLRLLIVGLAMAAYVAAVGPRPAVLRAAIMGWTALGALALKRPPLSLQTLCVAIVLILLGDPRAIVDRGFLLSISATAGLVVALPLLVKRWKARSRPLATGLAVTCAAQVASWPFLLPWSPWLSPAAPWLNLIAVPWLCLTLASSVLATVASTLGAPDLGPTLAAPSILLLDSLAASRPWTIPIAVGWFGATVLSITVWLGLVWPKRIGGWLLAGALVLPLWRPAAAEPSDVEWVVLDVGQGDSLLLRYGQAGVLFDGGGWQRGDVGGRLVAALAGLGVRRLDAVVLTHPDTDHCRGLVDLAAYRPIAEIWTPPAWRSGCAKDLLGRRGVRWRPLWRGRGASIGPVEVETLWPPPGSRGDGNGRSLALRVEVAGRTLLLTGDLEAAEERRLLALDRSALAADLLKIGHHGSKTSTLGPFLDAVAPRRAMISAGRDNAYGHPHPRVVERLHERRIATWRTDRHGAIRLTWSGSSAPIRATVEAAEPPRDW